MVGHTACDSAPKAILVFAVFREGRSSYFQSPSSSFDLVSFHQSAMCFHLFPLLQTEIRLQIWIMTFPESRRFIQTIRRHSVFQNRARTDPTALRVNRESREAALFYYSARDLARLKHHEARYNIRYPAYINFTKDVISFLDPWDYEAFHGYAKWGINSISDQEMHCIKRVELIVCIPKGWLSLVFGQSPGVERHHKLFPQSNTHLSQCTIHP